MPQRLAAGMKTVCDSVSPWRCELSAGGDPVFCRDDAYVARRAVIPPGLWWILDCCVTTRRRARHARPLRLEPPPALATTGGPPCPPLQQTTLLSAGTCNVLCNARTRGLQPLPPLPVQPHHLLYADILAEPSGADRIADLHDEGEDHLKPVRECSRMREEAEVCRSW